MIRINQLVVLLAVALTAACDILGFGSSATQDLGQAGANRDPATLVIGRAADAISLDPGRITDNESVEVCEQIYDKLLRYQSGSNTIEPGLATTWKASEEGRVWTFQLRKNVVFHDGTPLNAEAVVFSLERQRDPDHPFHDKDRSDLPFAYWENTYKNVTKIEAIGEYEVRITIERRYAPFEANMAMFPVAIVSPTAVKKWGPEYYRHPTGTGPFKFGSWEDGRIVLEKNEKYWDGVPDMQRLVFRAMPDGRQRLVALESGSIDVAYSIPPEELQFVELHPELRLYRNPANNVAYLAMNNTHPPFDDQRVRRAANFAVNKDPIVKLAYQGLAVSAEGPLPPTQWGYRASQQRYKYDPARARALLEEAAAAGAFDPEKTYDLYVSSTPRPYLPAPEVVARVLQANLNAVGLKTRLVVQGFRAHLSAVQRGEHDLCLLGWVGDNGDPDNFLYVLFDKDNTTPGIARNVAFYRDERTHELLVSAQVSSSREERAQIYAQVQDRIASQAPWVPIAHSEVAVAARRDVGGIVISPSTHIEFKSVKRIVR